MVQLHQIASSNNFLNIILWTNKKFIIKNLYYKIIYSNYTLYVNYKT